LNLSTFFSASLIFGAKLQCIRQNDFSVKHFFDYVQNSSVASVEKFISEATKDRAVDDHARRELSRPARSDCVREENHVILP
jgi:hypothetical protein